MTQFFKGTSKNPRIDTNPTRREKIVIERETMVNPEILKTKNKLALSSLFKHCISSLCYLKNIFTKNNIYSLWSELYITSKFVLLFFVYLISKGIIRIAKYPILPTIAKNKTGNILNRIYFKSIDILDPHIPGSISKITLIDLSIRNMLSKKNRTNITVGGMAIGIAAIVFLVSIGYGLQQLVISRVASLDQLSQADVTTQLGSKIKIDDNAIANIKNIPEVLSVNPVISVVGTVNYQNSVSDMAVYGVQAAYLQHASLQLLEGSFFKSNSLAMVLPPTPNSQSDTAVLGISTSTSSNNSVEVGMNSEIQSIQYSIQPNIWVRVHQNPTANSPLIGYTKRADGVSTGEELWGGTYLSNDNQGRSGRNATGIWFGKWIKSPLFLWTKQPCDIKSQGDCEDGNYMVMRDNDGHQVEKTGYFAASNAELTGTSIASQQVLGASTNTLGVQTNNSGSIPFVQIASLSAPLKPNKSKIVSLGTNALKQAVVNIATLNILGLNQNSAVGKTFQATFTATGNLLNNPTENLQSKPTTYTIVGVINGNKTPIFYVPFIDLRSMGITNYSTLRVTVNSKDILTNIRKQIESQGFVTTSVADTVAQINSVFGTAQTILALVGFIALAVAALGMFNTLTVSLLERTREVGLMKSMGMRSEEVKDLFLTESLIMAMFGGIIGLFFGFLGGEILSLILSIFAISKGVGFIQISYIPFGFILLILVLSLMVGLLTGIYPARRAKRISALNALRYE